MGLILRGRMERIALWHSWGCSLVVAPFGASIQKKEQFCYECTCLSQYKAPQKRSCLARCPFGLGYNYDYYDQSSVLLLFVLCLFFGPSGVTLHVGRGLLELKIVAYCAVQVRGVTVSGGRACSRQKQSPSMLP